MTRICWLLIMTLVYCLPCLSQTKQPSARMSPVQIEARVFKLLSDGKQSDAEHLLESKVSVHRDNQRVVFLLACCLRSRFLVREAAPVFMAVADMGTNSIAGQCAIHILFLDAKKEIEKHFGALRDLVEKNPNDAMLRWMIAVQCRAFNRNEEGVKHYAKLLEQWTPGPVLVHQTYGNLLDELSRYEEALVERRKAVELEPAGWSYQGLGYTLASLNRFAEANQAYAKSVACDPDRSSYWVSWAWGLIREGKYPEAIGKCEQATTLDSKDYRAWSQWGRALELQGKFQDALVKYRKAVEINKAFEFANKRILEVEKQIGSQHSPAR